MDAVVEKCLLVGCQRPVARSGRGRPGKFCCDAHRKAHSRLNGQKKGHPGLPHRVREKSSKSAPQTVKLIPGRGIAMRRF
jgi:hypothetical protein